MTGPPTVVSPAPRAAWAELLAADVDALPEHDPAWVDALQSAGPYADASRLYRFADGRRFVLPMVRGRGPLGRGFAATYPPAWGIGGLVGPDQDAQVIGHVLDDLGDTGLLRVAIRPDPLRSGLWAAATAGRSLTTIPRRAHVADLTGGFDAVEGRMKSATRKYVRRAQRAGVEVQLETGPQLLPDFYRLFDTSISRWATRQHEPLALARFRAHRRDPLRKLEAMAEHLGESFVVALATVEGRPAFASIMLLGRTAHVTRSAMDVDTVGQTKAGALVHWTLMRLAAERGCRSYHLGESGASRPLAQFKESFGAEPVDYAEYRLERLPFTAADTAARTAVKRVLRFRDT